MAALTSGARSCWVQWPQPGSMIAGRSLGTIADCFAMNLGIGGGDKIALARHVERRNGHRRSGKGSQQLPAAIDVAPPGEGTAEPAPREFRDVNIDVGLRDPGGKDAGSVKGAPFRGIIPAANPPPADGGLSPESE